MNKALKCYFDSTMKFLLVHQVLIIMMIVSYNTIIYIIIVSVIIYLAICWGVSPKDGLTLM